MKPQYDIYLKRDLKYKNKNNKTDVVKQPELKYNFF